MFLFCLIGDDPHPRQHFMRVRILGRKRVLTEEERYEVADDVIYQLRKHGDRWKLDEPIEPPPTHST
jgi:hypothetical protein